MKRSILSARMQIAIGKISKASGTDINDVPKGNTQHKNLFILEKIADLVDAGFDSHLMSLNEVLSIEGLSVKSKKAIEAM